MAPVGVVRKGDVCVCGVAVVAEEGGCRGILSVASAQHAGEVGRLQHRVQVWNLAWVVPDDVHDGQDCVRNLALARQSPYTAVGQNQCLWQACTGLTCATAATERLWCWWRETLCCCSSELGWSTLSEFRQADKCRCTGGRQGPA